MSVQNDVSATFLLAGCFALLGALNGSGFTLRDLNVTALEKRKSNVGGVSVTGLISMIKATHFLIEGCTFLHLTTLTDSQVLLRPIYIIISYLRDSN